MDGFVGKRIGKLTVLERTKKIGSTRIYNAYLCRCDCGTTKVIRRDYLVSPKAKSCGCYRKEASIIATRTHGMSKGSKNYHPLYSVWDGIIQRCTNPKSDPYNLYGKRGITICEEWRLDFASFYNWAINNGYKKGLQIDRIDNDKGYCPENCRFATTYIQSRNKRSNVFVEFRGERMCLQDVANITGIDRSTLYYRHMKGKQLI